MKKIDYTPRVKPVKVQRYGKGPVPSGIKPWTTVDTSACVRATQTYRSVSTPGGSTALKQSPQYSGSAIVGIATMHKSNLVPVFSKEAATDTASMRR